MVRHLKNKHPTQAVPRDPLITDVLIAANPMRNLDTLVDLLSGCLLPFSILEDESFRSFVLRLAPAFCRNAFDRHELRLHAEQILESRFQRWKDILNTGAPSPVVALDLWSAKNSVSVVGTTAHWISEEWLMRLMALDIQEIQQPHTAENIVTVLKKTFDSWGIMKLFATVRDRGSNVVAATHRLGNITEWDLDCCAHGLNNCVVNSINEVEAVKTTIDLVQSVVRHLRKSHKSWTIYADDYQARNFGKTAKRPVSNSKTRWYSTYLMLQWHSNAQDSLVEVMPKIDKLKDIEVTRSQRRILEDVQALLRPLADATRLIEADEFPTLAWIVEIQFLLLKHTKTFKPQSHAGEMFCQALQAELTNRFTELPEIVWMAALLTPCLRESPALDGHREDAWALLKARYTEIAETPVQENSEGEQNVTEEPVPGDTSLNALRLRFSSTRSSNRTTDLYQEFKRYKAVPGCQVNTLSWWKANEAIFPRMAIIARKILAVVGSSGPVERLFSTLGNTYTNKRSRLSVATARCQVLLHENKMF